MWLRAMVIGTVLVVGLAACGGDGDAEPGAVDTGSAAAEGADVELAVAGSDLGDIVVDGDGMTLYVFDNDTDGTSVCVEECAQTWPPLTGVAGAGDGVDAALIGAVDREDGSSQVTYDGRPLYHFAPDTAPGDTNGQAVGDVWWVVGPDGPAISETTSPTAEATESGSSSAADLGY